MCRAAILAVMLFIVAARAPPAPALSLLTTFAGPQILFLGVIAPLMGTFQVTPLVTNDFVFFETARVCFSR